MTLQQYYIVKYEGLSKRAKNVLIEINCSFYKIYALSKERILAAPNCGLQTADEIMEFVDDIVAKYPLKSEDFEDIRMKALDDVVVENITMLSASTKKFITKHSIKTYNELLSVLCGLEIIPRIRQELEQYVNICKSLTERIILLCNIIRKYGHRIDNTINSYLRDYMRSHCWNDNVIEKAGKIFPHYYDVLCINIETYKDSRTTLYKLLNDTQNILIERINEIMKLEDEQVQILVKYPSVNFEDVRFISEYKKEHNIIPVFFVIERLFFTIFTSHEQFALREYFGFYNEAKDSVQISEEMGVGAFHVLQIVRNSITRYNVYLRELIDVPENQLFQQYPFLNNSFITEDNSNWNAIVSQERIHYSFSAFCLFCSMLSPSLNVYEIIRTPNGNVSKWRYQSQIYHAEIYVHTRELEQFDFYEAIYQIQVEKRKHKTSCLDWKRYCFRDSLWRNGVVQELVPDVIGGLAFLLNKLWGIKDSDESMYSNVEQGEKVNVRQFIYEYIKTQKKPVHVDEVFIAFKQEYPQYPFTDSNQIRTYLCKDERLQPIGRSSLYVVAESQQFKGSLQNAVIEVLKKKKEPMGKEDIYKAVLFLRPDSSENSLRTILSSMVKSGILQKTETMQYDINVKR